MADVDISGLDKVKVLQVLYNAKAPMGMGMLHYTPEALSGEDAKLYIESHTYQDPEGPMTYFDYVEGRPLKVDIAGDTIDPKLYDREGGPGMCEFVIFVLRTFDDPIHPIIQEVHKNGMEKAISYAEFLVAEQSPRADEIINIGGQQTIVKSLDGSLLGNEKLGEAIKRARESLRG